MISSIKDLGFICHATTGTYNKPSAGAGHPAGYNGKAKFDKKPVDLLKVAHNVSLPERDDCLVCHAYGGGNNVKHGDIGKALTNPTVDVIFHMVAEAGKALGCLDCHGDNGRLNWKELGYKGDPLSK